MLARNASNISTQHKSCVHISTRRHANLVIAQTFITAGWASRLCSPYFEAKPRTPVYVQVYVLQNDTSGADQTFRSKSDSFFLESLNVLEWSSVARQVACFCATSMGAEALQVGGLPLGSSPETSRRLLQQTTEALDMGLSLPRIYDLDPAVTAVADEIVLSAKQMEGVAEALEAALALKQRVTVRSQQVDNEGGGALEDLRYPSLAVFADGIVEGAARLLSVIRTCIKKGSVSDEASEKLAAVRKERRDNLSQLRELMNTLARNLFQKGASDNKTPSIMRNRMCVALKAGRQGELGKGSVRLGASASGATLYVEPAAAVLMNNNEVLLAEQEETEVARVLVILSRVLAEHSKDVRSVMAAVKELDIVAARARHARWIQGTKPEIMDSPDSMPPGTPLIWVEGAMHPLLMQPALDPLPQPPSSDDYRLDRNFMEQPAWELRRPAVMPDAPAEGTLPAPLDLRVPANKSVVAITGPNTGGKTVALKTLGLMVLMARAGMYLPARAGGSTGDTGPRVCWFSDVLADIGDSQSLTQSLSTFSGHVRRIKQILSSVSASSLVLLDELGSGTDPAEGAALARAVLDTLAARAPLTVATTHHAALRLAANEDARYINAAMEFNPITLRPTYRVLWNVAGASNALEIASYLGFDAQVVAEAWKLMSSSSSSNGSHIGSNSTSTVDRSTAVADALAEQLREAEENLRAAAEAREALEAEMEKERRRIARAMELNKRLKDSPSLIVQERDEHIRSLREALRGLLNGEAERDEVEEAFAALKAQIPERVEYFHRPVRVEDKMFKKGDLVQILSMGPLGFGRVQSMTEKHVKVELEMSFLMTSDEKKRTLLVPKKEVQLVKKSVGPAPLPFSSLKEVEDETASTRRRDSSPASA